MGILPNALESLIDAFGMLPGVGKRTAERYAYYVLRHPAAKSTELANALSTLHGNIGICKKTFALVDIGTELSPLYTDPKRNKKLIAVVAEPFDLLPLESTAQFHGTYHVLGGLISPIDGVGPGDLHIAELVQRITDDEVEEIILATNASVEGETTALYIQQQLQGQNVKLTRLARGLPVGVDLEYADQITLGRALEGRQQL
jgi:recombination protein RecR